MQAIRLHQIALLLIWLCTACRHTFTHTTLRSSTQVHVLFMHSVVWAADLCKLSLLG